MTFLESSATTILDQLVTFGTDQLDGMASSSKLDSLLKLINLSYKLEEEKAIIISDRSRLDLVDQILTDTDIQINKLQSEKTQLIKKLMATTAMITQYTDLRSQLTDIKTKTQADIQHKTDTVFDPIRQQVNTLREEHAFSLIPSNIIQEELDSTANAYLQQRREAWQSDGIQTPDTHARSKQSTTSSVESTPDDSKRSRRKR